jgi:hypothetical protein
MFPVQGEKMLDGMLPVNRLAGRVVSSSKEHGSVHPRFQNLYDSPPYSKLPVPKYAKNYTHHRRGRIKVLYFIGKENHFAAAQKNRWVCRCDCGKYVIRKNRSLCKNNQDDMCPLCLWSRKKQKTP